MRFFFVVGGWFSFFYYYFSDELVHFTIFFSFFLWRHLTNVFLFYFIFATIKQLHKTIILFFFCFFFFSMPYLLMKIKLEAINFHESWEEKRKTFYIFFLLRLWWFLINFYTSDNNTYIFLGVSLSLYMFYRSQYYTLRRRRRNRIYFSFIDFSTSLSLSLTHSLSFCWFVFQREENNEKRAKEIFLWLNICYIYHIIQNILSLRYHTDAHFLSTIFAHFYFFSSCK